MYMDMEPKVAIVTGAGRGLGQAFAEILLHHRYKVCISDINVKQGKSTLEELQTKHGDHWVKFYPCDVTKQDQLEDLFEDTVATFGQINLVVNHAGILCESDWKSVVDVNLTAVIQGTLLAIKYMGTHNGGRGGLIINTSSLAGIIPINIAPHYTSTKYGVVGFTKSIARVAEEFYGMRINAICPSYTDTEFVNFKPEDLSRGLLYGPDLENRIANSLVELGPGLIPIEDVAKCFMVLVKDETLNGQMMVVTQQGSGVTSKAPGTLKQVLELEVPNRL